MDNQLAYSEIFRQDPSGMLSEVERVREIDEGLLVKFAGRKRRGFIAWEQLGTRSLRVGAKVTVWWSEPRAHDPGSYVRGLSIGKQVVFFETEREFRERRRAAFERSLERRWIEEERNFESIRHVLDDAQLGLHPLFRDRIQRLREQHPHFRVHGEFDEVAVLVAATGLMDHWAAEGVAKSERSIHAAIKVELARGTSLVGGIAAETLDAYIKAVEKPSGRSAPGFAGIVYFAERCYLNDRRDVLEAHSAAQHYAASPPSLALSRATPAPTLAMVE